MRNSTLIMVIVVACAGIAMAIYQVRTLTSIGKEIEPEWAYLCRSGGITLVAGTGTNFKRKDSGYMYIIDSDTKNERYIKADCLVDKI